jgi:hypothetical protein
MGVYRGVTQDNVTIEKGTLYDVTLSNPTITGTLTGNVVGNITFPVAAVAAAGSNSTDATAISDYGVVHATGADGTKGVKLPVAAAGKVVIVKNSDAANAILKVYPATGDKINSGTATTGSLNMAAKTSAVLVAIDATDWFSIPLLPS